MNKEFTFYLLNDEGLKKSRLIAQAFDELLTGLKGIIPESREFSICKTKLEESCFFAKKAMAEDPVNHSAKNKLE